MQTIKKTENSYLDSEKNLVFFEISITGGISIQRELKFLPHLLLFRAANFIAASFIQACRFIAGLLFCQSP